MHIAIEFNSVLTTRYSGFYTYGAGLLEGFVQLAQRPEITLFCGRKSYQNASWINELVQELNCRWKVSPLKLRHLGLWWRYFNRPSLQYFTGPLDLYHCNHHLMPPTQNKPRLLTVHDLRRYRYRQFYPHSKLAPFENAVKKADHFIAISQATKSDLQEIFNIPDNRIDVVYHGGPLNRCTSEPSPPTNQRDSLLEQFRLQPQHYFTVFSSYDRRKNLPNIVRAFLHAADGLDKGCRLVVIGQLPRREDIIPADCPTSLNERIVCTGPLQDFTSLLSNSTALIYASLYEGFGLPILEAMSANCPVITSNCSSMPEIAADAAVFVDPLNPEEIAQALIDIARNETQRKELVQAGSLRARQFSWARAARETFAVYQKLI